MSDNAKMGTDLNAKQAIPLRIDRLPDGGFVVSETHSLNDNGRFCASLFASTSIGEALEFIARRLDPAALEAAKAAQAKAAEAVNRRCNRSASGFCTGRPDCGSPDCGSSTLATLRRCSRCSSPFARVNAGEDWSGF